MRVLRLYLLFCLVVVSLLAGLAFLEAQLRKSKERAQVDVAATSFAGCYELKLGRWWPWSFGGDNEFVTPPSTIELLPVRGTEGFETEGFLIRRIPPAQASAIARKQASYWQVRSTNDVELTWTTGFSGVALNLSKHGDDLRGWAHPFFDFPTAPRIMHLTARRIFCPARSRSDASTTSAAADTGSRSGKVPEESETADDLHNLRVLGIFAGSLVAVIIVGYLLARRSEGTRFRAMGAMMVAVPTGFVGLVMLWWLIGVAKPFPVLDVSSYWETLVFVAVFSVFPFGAFYVSAKFIRMAKGRPTFS